MDMDNSVVWSKGGEGKAGGDGQRGGSEGHLQ